MALNSPAGRISPTNDQESTPDEGRTANPADGFVRPLDPAAVAAAFSDSDHEWLSTSHDLNLATDVAADSNSAPNDALDDLREEIGRVQVMHHFDHS
jgi:hypothetical protein